ncbi:hypothetical protein NORO109296_26635 [Nocardiopsis rhodophaea]
MAASTRALFCTGMSKSIMTGMPMPTVSPLLGWFCFSSSRLPTTASWVENSLVNSLLSPPLSTTAVTVTSLPGASVQSLTHSVLSPLSVPEAGMSSPESSAPSSGTGVLSSIFTSVISPPEAVTVTGRSGRTSVAPSSGEMDTSRGPESVASCEASSLAPPEQAVAANMTAAVHTAADHRARDNQGGTRDAAKSSRAYRSGHAA